MRSFWPEPFKNYILGSLNLTLLRVAAALEGQTNPIRIPPTDESAGKRKEGLVNVAPLLLTDAECAKQNSR
jgi:hypothetical protein